MKTYNEIRNEINETYRKLDVLKAEKREVEDDWYAMEFEQKKGTYKDYNEKLKSFKNLIQRNELMIQFLNNNANYALYHEVMPIALEILKKYKNKPYGEKTKQKISDEVKEATGCRFYIHCRYGDNYEYDIYPTDCVGNTHSLMVYAGYIDGQCKKFLVDNKIQVVEMEDLRVSGVSEYVENISEVIDQIYTIHAEALEKQKELDEICSKYNSLVVGNISHLNACSRIASNVI